MWVNKGVKYYQSFVAKSANGIVSYGETPATDGLGYMFYTKVFFWYCIAVYSSIILSENCLNLVDVNLKACIMSYGQGFNGEQFETEWLKSAWSDLE